MLYVSRIAGMNKWVVTDTDDGVENVVTFEHIRDAIEKSHLVIEGCDVEHKVNRRGESVKLNKVWVYQDPTQVTPAQTKAKIMTGVDVVTNRGRILAVQYLSSTLRKGTRIRLSSFGKSLENFAFMGSPVITGDRLTIVLDDKIKVHQRALKHAFGYKVHVDMTEVTNTLTPRYVYEELIRQRSAVQDWGMFVTDIESRQRLWKTVGVVCAGPTDKFTPTLEEAEKVGQMFLKEFSSLLAVKFRMPVESINTIELKIQMARVKQNRDFWRSNCQDYDKVRGTDHNAFATLGQIASVNYYKLRRMRNYFDMFDLGPAMQVWYVQSVNYINNWILDVVEGVV